MAVIVLVNVVTIFSIVFIALLVVVNIIVVVDLGSRAGPSTRYDLCRVVRLIILITKS